MTANLTPQYRQAQQRFKEATSHDEKVAALEDMIAELPKHKGTEKMFAALKKQLSELKEHPAGRGAVARVDPFHVTRAGAGQVALLGLPNVGKSALVAATTHAPVVVADYPFTTQLPAPGMAHFEDVPIQLIDLPPITADHVPPGMAGTLRLADLILLIADAASPDVLDQVETPLAMLHEKQILVDSEDDLTLHSKLHEALIIVLTKCNLPEAAESVQTIRELYASAYRIHEISTISRQGLDELTKLLFDLLDVIRIYTKKPGKDPDMVSPFILRRGATVHDLARAIHRDLPDKLKSAKVWGSAKFDGQTVKRDYVLEDKDIVEIHE